MRKVHAALELDPSADDRVPAHPFLKWAGGKWAIASRIEGLLPHDTRERVYREPFLGGGAMFFYLQPRRAFLSDSLGDLATTYQVVQHSVGALITHLEKLRATHGTEQFYAIRAAFNEQRSAPRVERAAWLIYLNKTCFNGLFRTNQSGGFNVPGGPLRQPAHRRPAGPPPGGGRALRRRHRARLVRSPARGGRAGRRHLPRSPVRPPQQDVELRRLCRRGLHARRPDPPRRRLPRARRARLPPRPLQQRHPRGAPALRGLRHLADHRPPRHQRQGLHARRRDGAAHPQHLPGTLAWAPRGAPAWRGRARRSTRRKPC